MASVAYSKETRGLTSILKSGNSIIAREKVLEIFRTDCVDLNSLTLKLRNIQL